MNKPAYFIFDVKINDPEAMKPYQAKVEETFTAYGGRRIVSGGHIETLEGQGPQGKIVILQFDSMEQAKIWHESPEYQAIIGFRHQAAESNGYLVEGIA